MKNSNSWKETKFTSSSQGYSLVSDPSYSVSVDCKNVAISSRFIAAIQLEVYRQAIEKHAHGILLDLGCGNVPLYGLYKNRVIDNICIDWDSSLHENPYLDIVADLNSGIPTESDYFDTILSTDVLEHIAQPDLMMREISRVLKPGGKLILTVPFFYWLHETPYDYFRYTEFSLRMFCEKNKMDILSLSPYGGALEVILDIIAKQIPRFRFLSLVHFRLSKILMQSSLGQKISSKTAKKFPLGYCLVAQKNLSK